MDENSLKIGTLTLESSVSLIITTNNNQFIGRAEMRELEGCNVLEVVSTVARPTYGKLLYQSMAQYAFNVNKTIASSRDGATRSAALALWERFFKTLNPLHIKALPPHINTEVEDGLDEEECKPYTHAYCMPSSNAFNANFVDLNKAPASNFAKDMLRVLEESADYFRISYELDGNKWIDEDMPLLENELTA